jgi:tripartite-type tricarboxylate transporter receptor subunit TctC
VFAVNSASPYQTLTDVIEAARAKPGTLTFASVGPGSPHHIAFEMLKRAAKMEMTYVPFPGGGPAINALLGGHVTLGMAEYAPLSAHLEAGTLRALATSAKRRVGQLPDVPTVAELGYPDYEVDMWWSVFAPAKISPMELSQLSRWFGEALQSPELKARFAMQGFSPVGRCGADFASILQKQYEDYGRIVREAHLAIE